MAPPPTDLERVLLQIRDLSRQLTPLTGTLSRTATRLQTFVADLDHSSSLAGATASLADALNTAQAHAGVILELTALVHERAEHVRQLARDSQAELDAAPERHNGAAWPGRPLLAEAMYCTHTALLAHTERMLAGGPALSVFEYMTSAACGEQHGLLLEEAQASALHQDFHRELAAAAFAHQQRQPDAAQRAVQRMRLAHQRLSDWLRPEPEPAAGADPLETRWPDESQLVDRQRVELHMAVSG